LLLLTSSFWSRNKKKSSSSSLSSPLLPLSSWQSTKEGTCGRSRTRKLVRLTAPPVTVGDGRRFRWLPLRNLAARTLLGLTVSSTLVVGVTGVAVAVPVASDVSVTEWRCMEFRRVLVLLLLLPLVWPWLWLLPSETTAATALVRCRTTSSMVAVHPRRIRQAQRPVDDPFNNKITTKLPRKMMCVLLRLHAWMMFFYSVQLSVLPVMCSAYLHVQYWVGT